MMRSDHSDAEVLARMEQWLGSVGSELPRIGDGMAAYLQGGKRLRAGLLIAIAVRGPKVDEERAARYAMFVELMHAGGLCHDDVVDRSSTRRGRPSIGAAHGERAAAIGGMYLMTRAYGLIAGEDDTIRSLAAEFGQRVARGQAREMTDLYDERVSEIDYLARISDKTGALFELAAALGGEAGGYSDAARVALCEYAMHAGVAFQLADDVRDIVGGATLGRERGTDLREGVYTLPTLRALRNEGGTGLGLLLRRLRIERSQELAERCCDIVVERGGIARAIQLIEQHLVVARAIAASSGALAKPLESLLRSLSGDYEMHGIRHAHGM